MRIELQIFVSLVQDDAHDHFFAHLGSISTVFRQNPATRGTGAPSSERWEESAKTRLPRTCGGGMEHVTSTIE